MLLQNWDNKEINLGCKGEQNNMVPGDFVQTWPNLCKHTEQCPLTESTERQNSMNFFSDSIQATKLGSQILVQKCYVSNFDKETGAVQADLKVPSYEIGSGHA